MTDAPRERADRLRALTEQLRGTVAEVARAGDQARAAVRDLSRDDVRGTPEYRRLERESAESFRSGRAGAAARTLQERVDRGELTWQRIREGGAGPEVTRLYLENQAAMLSEMARVQRGIEEAEDAEKAAADEARERRRRARDEEGEPMTILKRRGGGPRRDGG